MFARVIEIKTKAGKAPALCHAIHDKVLSVLKAQPGFVDEIVLISETEEDKVLAISFWKTREDEQKYSAARNYDMLMSIYNKAMKAEQVAEPIAVPEVA